MPAVYDSLVLSRGLSPHKAWRVAYIVPFIIITVIALGMLFFCEDTPTGKWSDRHFLMKESSSTITDGNIIDINSGNPSSGASTAPSVRNLGTIDIEKKGTQSPQVVDKDSSETGEIDTLKRESVVSPSRKEALEVTFSLSTFAVAVPYACSFGSELAIDSTLGTYYAANFRSMGQTESGRWAAMFGLLNIVFRPAGGLFADLIYSLTGSVWSKKLLLSFLGIDMGAFLLAIGLSNPTSETTMFGLFAGLAFFVEACNGANFAVVPHVHPFANGKLVHFLELN